VYVSNAKVGTMQVDKAVLLVKLAAKLVTQLDVVNADLVLSKKVTAATHPLVEGVH
jgi:hypothetical protein